MAFLGVAVAMLLLLPANISQRAKAAGAYRICRYWQDDLLAALQRNGVSLDTIWEARRTPCSRGLLVFGKSSGVPTCVEIQFGPGTLRTWQVPSTTCWVGESNNPVAWRGGAADQVCFSTGEQVTLPRFALFDVDPLGHYFVIGEKPNRTWIGKIGAVNARCLISEDLLGDRVFTQSNYVYVCGGTYATDPETGGILPGARCLVLEDSGGHWEVIERHDLPWAAGVVDKAASEEKLLVQAKGDFSPQLFIYDLRSRLKVRVGPAKACNFLLLGDPLDSLSHRKRVSSHD